MLTSGVFISCDDNDDDDGGSENTGFVIENGVLKGYYGQSGDVTIPSGVKVIGYRAFGALQGAGEELRSVTIPESVTEIEDEAFYERSSLRNVKLPNKLEKIGQNAFYYCISLESIEIPVSVTTMKEGVFLGCKSLDHVYYAGTKEQWGNLTGGLHLFYDDSSTSSDTYETTIHCADGTLTVTRKY